MASPRRAFSDSLEVATNILLKPQLLRSLTGIFPQRGQPCGWKTKYLGRRGKVSVACRNDRQGQIISGMIGADRIVLAFRGATRGTDTVVTIIRSLSGGKCKQLDDA